MMPTWTRTTPLITGGLAVAAVTASLLLPEVVAYDRAAILAGESWRVITGHAVHFTAEHLFWDIVGFVVLGAIIERRSRAAMLATVAASGLAISGWLLALAPTIVTYRGLSGIDSALLACAAVLCMRQRPILSITALLGFGGKVGYEVATGQMLFAQDLGGAAGLPMVHAIGAAVGLAVGLLAARGGVTRALSRADTGARPAAGTGCRSPRRRGASSPRGSGPGGWARRCPTSPSSAPPS